MNIIPINNIGGGVIPLLNNKIKNIENSLSNKASKSGDTFTGDIVVNKSAPAISVTNGTRNIGLHVGSDGTNRGIFDFEENCWLFCHNDQGYYINNGDLIITDKNNSNLKSYYESQPTSANLPILGDGKLRHFRATSSMTEGKPSSDGSIIHLAWDNNGGFDTELFISNNTTFDSSIGIRNQTGGSSWNNWHYLLLRDSIHTEVKLVNYTTGATAGARFECGKITIPTCLMWGLNVRFIYAYSSYQKCWLASDNNSTISNIYGFYDNQANYCNFPNISITGVAGGDDIYVLAQCTNANVVNNYSYKLWYIT